MWKRVTVRAKTIQVGERMSRFKGYNDWLYLLLLNFYWIIYENILSWIEGLWKFGKERKPHVL